MRMDNVQMLHSTLDICYKGFYKTDSGKVKLKLSKKEMEEVQVFLPDEVEAMKQSAPLRTVMQKTGFTCCENTDTLTMARKKMQAGKPNILILNFANPVHPGGGVRRGASAQEEGLCRKSSLLLSLESEKARRYYDYNSSLNTFMGSDAIIITPQVEIIRGSHGELLDETAVISVMTCAAPDIVFGMEGLSEEEYENMFRNRISGMLYCAAHLGYQHLVLGAFGCGAFGNDARVVSDLFYQALKNFEMAGKKEHEVFREIDFAVLSRSGYNYQEFWRNFGENNFYRNEYAPSDFPILREIRESEEKYLDRIAGSLVGGAVGDALGYPVEFLTRRQILAEYGEEGITEYDIAGSSGKALISDDTQMTLFTANGILVGETRLELRGIGGVPHDYITYSYQDWLTTQESRFSANAERTDAPRYSWLLDVPELYSQRAPGLTCLSALRKARWEGYSEEFIRAPRNSSKGCGGIMRVAPLGLHYRTVPMKELDREGAEIAAITHGHPLGYLPAAVLTHVLNRIVYPKNPEMTLKEIILEAKDTVSEIFKDTNHLKDLNDKIDLAVALSENRKKDSENIRCLGEGWVAEETLAIALYCALRHEHDFAGGVIAAVNHDGDSDSTGAVAGNILGALNGYEAIGTEWTENLELLDVLKEMSIDLCHGCRMSQYGSYTDRDWMRKYVKMRWK